MPLYKLNAVNTDPAAWQTMIVQDTDEGQARTAANNWAILQGNPSAGLWTDEGASTIEQVDRAATLILCYTTEKL